VFFVGTLLGVMPLGLLCIRAGHALKQATQDARWSGYGWENGVLLAASICFGLLPTVIQHAPHRHSKDEVIK
jgi:hypothetical protein